MLLPRNLYFGSSVGGIICSKALSSDIFHAYFRLVYWADFFKDVGLVMHVAIPMTLPGFSKSGQR